MPNHLDLRHTLTINGAYILVPRADLNVGGVAVPYYWLNEFERTLACNFSHHLGGYAQTDALRESLRIIYIYYHGLNGHPINLNEQSAIKDKIVEGVENCTPGFHNRVNQIVTGFQLPDSIDALMMAYRTDIVSRAASAHTADVHGHNQYAMIANQMGKNVSVLNADDPYIFLPPAEVRIKLTEAFRLHYHPLAIIENVVAAYQSVLMGHYDYTGNKARGYAVGDYEEWRSYLAKLLLLDAETIKLDDFLQFDEDIINVIDINWPYVKEKFAVALLDKGCFYLSVAQHHAIEQLHKVAADFAALSLHAVLRLIPNEASLIKVLEGFARHNSARTYVLLNEYIIQHAYTEAETELLARKLLNRPIFVPLMDAYAAERPNFYRNELFRLDQRNNNGLVRVLAANQVECFPPYLQVLRSLSLIQLQSAFSRPGLQNNPLMQAALTAAWAMPDLMALILRHPDHLRHLLSDRNAAGQNVLMMAIQTANQEAVLAITIGARTIGLDFLRSQLQNSAAMVHAVKRKAELFEIILNAWRACGAQQLTQQLLMSRDNLGDGLFICAIKANQHAVVPALYRAATQYLAGGVRELLTINNHDHENVFMRPLRLQDPLLPAFIAALQAMDLETRQAFLLDKNADGRNLLMLCAEYAPQFFNQYVALYDSLNMDAKRDAYRVMSRARSNNLLMQALLSHPHLAVTIIRQVRNLAAGELSILMSHINRSGQNTLMFAVAQGVDAVTAVLEGMTEQELRIALMARRPLDQADVLLLAASKDEPTFRLILNAWCQMPNADLAQALQTCDFRGETLFTRAIYANQLAIVAPLLQAGQIYLGGDVMPLLSNPQIENVLMHVLQAQPVNTDLLLRSLASLTDVDAVSLERILLAQKDGCNLLMCCVQHGNVQIFDALQALYEKLDEPTRRLVYTEVNDEGQTILEFAVLERAQFVKPLLQASQCLGEEVLFELMSHQSANHDTVMDHAIESNDWWASCQRLVAASYRLNQDKRRAILQIFEESATQKGGKIQNLFEVVKLLDALEKKSQEFDPVHIDASREAALLHQNLKQNFVAYLNADITDEQFSWAWRDQIARAKNSVLVEHRGYKEIAAMMLLCLSVLGLLVIAVKAVTHYVNGGNMRFFHVSKTDSEMLMDRLVSDEVLPYLNNDLE